MDAVHETGGSVGYWCCAGCGVNFTSMKDCDDKCKFIEGKDDSKII